MKYLFRLSLCLTLFAAIGSVQAQTVHRFSAKECADYAAKNNVQVKNALVDYQIQQQSNREISAQALPQVNGSASFTDNLQIATQLIPGDFVGQPGTFIPVQFGTKYIGSGALELSQMLFDGQVFVGLKARKTALDLSQKTVDLTEEGIRTNIYKIYYQLAVGKRQIELLDSNISRISKLQRDVRAMHGAGFAEAIDIDKAEVQLVNLQTEKLKAENMINSGRLALKMLMGMPVKDSLEMTETITEDDIRTGLGDNSYSYANRNDYQLSEIGRRLQEFNVRRYKLSYWPTLRFAISHSETAMRDKFNFFDGSETWFPSTYYNVNLQVPIFSGFRRDAQVKGAQLELQKAINNIDALKIQIDTEVEQARLSFTSSLVAVDAQRKNMELAEKVYDQTKKRYETGTGSNTDITNTQADLKAAQTNYISALYDAIIARIDYLKATGKLQ